jgi:hypothetical protein
LVYTMRAFSTIAGTSGKFVRSLEHISLDRTVSTQVQSIMMKWEEIKEEESEDTKPPYQDTSGKKHLSVCPITLRPFRKPVMGADGYTYERSVIVAWVERHGTSPMTRQPMRVDQLIPEPLSHRVSKGGWLSPLG